MLQLNTSSYLGSHLAVVHPPEGSEVCGLSAVEAVVKTSVVAIRKRYHELAFVLSHLLNENNNIYTHLGPTVVMLWPYM